MTCAKATVTCWIVTPEGFTYTGTNWCRNPQRECPRTAPGAYQRDDYFLCEAVCKQDGHAEVEALRKAGEWAIGATAYVDHHRVCKRCTYALNKAGVREIILGRPPE